jgi:hypothetical protein
VSGEARRKEVRDKEGLREEIIPKSQREQSRMMSRARCLVNINKLGIMNEQSQKKPPVPTIAGPERRLGERADALILVCRTPYYLHDEENPASGRKERTRAGLTVERSRAWEKKCDEAREGYLHTVEHDDPDATISEVLNW